MRAKKGVLRATVVAALLSLVPFAITLSHAEGQPTIDIRINDGCAQAGSCCFELFETCRGLLDHKYTPGPDGCS